MDTYIGGCTVYLYGLTGRPWSGWSDWWSMRGSRKAWHSHTYGQITRVLTQSPIVHLAVGSGNYVLDPMPTGDVLRDHLRYVARFPTVTFQLRVPTPHQVELVVDPRPYSGLSSLVRYVTCGLTPTRDCVQTAATTCRRAGLHVPWWVTTPTDIIDHLAAIDGAQLEVFE